MLFSTDYEDQIKIWNAKELDKDHTLNGKEIESPHLINGKGQTCIALSNDGELIATAA